MAQYNKKKLPFYVFIVQEMGAAINILFSISGKNFFYVFFTV